MHSTSRLLVSGDGVWCGPTLTLFFSGGKLFEPAGRISRRSAKHLGRNAGSCKLPALSYDSSFEVGETSTCHHWRKRTLESKTYEGLALSLRLLENYIDKAVSQLICEEHFFHSYELTCVIYTALDPGFSIVFG